MKFLCNIPRLQVCAALCYFYFVFFFINSPQAIYKVTPMHTKSDRKNRKNKTLLTLQTFLNTAKYVLLLLLFQSRKIERDSQRDKPMFLYVFVRIYVVCSKPARRERKKQIERSEPFYRFAFLSTFYWRLTVIEHSCYVFHCRQATFQSVYFISSERQKQRKEKIVHFACRLAQFHNQTRLVSIFLLLQQESALMLL